MSQTPLSQTPQPTAVSLKKNSVRAILGATVCALVFSRFIPDGSSYLEGFLLAGLIIYFLATGIWLRFAKIKSIGKTYYEGICTIDAIVVSAGLAFFLHSFPLSGMVLALVIFNATIVGYLRQALVDAGAFLIGSGAVSLAIGLEWGNSLNPTMLIIAFGGAAAYLLTFAAYVYRRFSKLNLVNKKLYNDLVQHKVRTYKLSRYVTPTVWAALNKGKDASLKTERKRVTVFFSDIAGFSSLSEELEAETLTELLNSYLSEMVKIAAKHRGTIDKFMGDGLMVLFGDTDSDGLKGDCLRCVSMAIAMRKKMKELESKWFNQGIKKPLKIRMGINSGYCTVGTFGTSNYMDYTVLGTHVNLASRLESGADPGEILISHETWSLIKDIVMCRDRGEIQAKGFSHPIKVYQVVDFRKDLGKNQSYFEEHVQGFSMHLDLERVKNYDRDRIIEHLENTAEKLRDKI